MMMKLIENIKNFINNYKTSLQNTGLVSISVIIIFIIIYLITYYVKTPNTLYSPLYVQTCVHTLKYNAAKLELVNEVDNYIKSVASQSSLDGYVIVEECLNNSIDICFVLAQGESESHFGTAGLARRIRKKVTSIAKAIDIKDESTLFME